MTNLLTNVAHVKWFNSTDPTGVEAFNSVEWLLILIILVLGLITFKYVSGYLKSHKIDTKLDKFFRPYRPFVPLIVRLSTVLLLLINSWQGYILAPNVVNDGSALAGFISNIFVISAIFIGLGLWTRFGVSILLFGYVMTFHYTNTVDVLDHFEYVAIAAYLWFRGPGPYSLQKKLSDSKKLRTPQNSKYSLPLYRIGVGIGVSILALSEKLLNVSVAQDFLNQYSWNMVAFVGISDRHFILIAGAIELVVGLALVLNYAPRVVITIVLMLMTVTAILLGVEEIFGHLFAVGVVAALWVNDAKPDKVE